MPRSSSDTRGKSHRFQPPSLQGQDCWVSLCPLQGWAAIPRKAGPFQSICYLLPGTSVHFRERESVQSGAVSADLGSEATDNFSEFFKTPSVFTSFCQPGWSRHTSLCATSFSSLSLLSTQFLSCPPYAGWLPH